MSNVHPILQDALDAVFPDHQRIAAEHKARRETVERLSKQEGANLQRLIEDLITKLHPEGDAATEILDALTASVESRYDNKWEALESIAECHTKLRAAYQNAFDSDEGEQPEKDDQYV